MALRCRIINLIDDCTRLAVASKPLASCTTAAAFDAFSPAPTRWGWPARFLSDNAKAFRYGLAAAVAALGVGPATPAPTTPRPAAKWNASTRP